MRFFRLISTAVLLLACVVLGSACAGAKGDTGPKGDSGADGVGVENIVNNGDGTFTLYLTDGDRYTTDNMTGPQGVKGDAGSQGAQGIQGEPGPNMIRAMGNIAADGTISYEYNVTSCTWDNMGLHYLITLTDICFSAIPWVTIITPDATAEGGAGWWDLGGGLLGVYIFDRDGLPIQARFSFMLLREP